MKLLLDQNLSRRILFQLDDGFPNSRHVVHLGMDRECDIAIWDYAKKEGYVIVTKDHDFLQRSVLMGHPPKVIHLQLGNCKVNDIARLLLDNRGHRFAFHQHASKSYLLLSKDVKG